MTRPRTPWIGCLAAALALAAAQPAAAQLLGGALTRLPTGFVGDAARQLPAPSAITEPVRKLPQDLAANAGVALSDLRRLRAAQLLRQHPDLVEADETGAPVVRGEVLAVSPTPAALEAARRAGFRIEGRSVSPELGLESVTFKSPAGLSAIEAVRRLRALDAAGQYDFNHLYQQSGTREFPAAHGATPTPRPKVRGARLGLVDGSADASHPALRRARLTQAAFAPGGARVSDHATAVASLLVGDAPGFQGAAPGGALFVADVYGPSPAGGSAAAIVQGLAWLARNNVAVVNISLVGPPNLLLGAAVRGLTARGVLVVAAVGNDGPAAPPLYPAAYPGVVAVTGVDAHRQALPEAGRGPFVAFAAPGAQMAAAVSGGYVAVRGTSFAAPLVAGELAQRLSAPQHAAAAHALISLAASAQDLGAPGRDPVYGYGLVGFDLRVDPQRVGARALALRSP